MTEDEAEEVVQETAVSVARNLPGYTMIPAFARSRPVAQSDPVARHGSIEKAKVERRIAGELAARSGQPGVLRSDETTRTATVERCRTQPARVRRRVGCGLRAASLNAPRSSEGADRSEAISNLRLLRAPWVARVAGGAHDGDQRGACLFGETPRGADAKQELAQKVESRVLTCFEVGKVMRSLPGFLISVRAVGAGKAEGNATTRKHQ